MVGKQVFCTGTVARANLGTTTCSPGRQDQASGRGGSRGARDGGESQHPVMNARGRHRKWSSNRARPVLSQLCPSLLQPRHRGWGSGGAGSTGQVPSILLASASSLVGGGTKNTHPHVLEGSGSLGPVHTVQGAGAASCRRPWPTDKPHCSAVLGPRPASW